MSGGIVYEKVETPPQVEPRLVDIDEKEPGMRLDEVTLPLETPPLEQVESEIKRYEGSVDFEKNFVLKAAYWKLQESLGKISGEEERNRLVLTFYRLMKGFIEPREFYEKIQMKQIYSYL